jgi:hypothetical protein
MKKRALCILISIIVLSITNCSNAALAPTNPPALPTNTTIPLPTSTSMPTATPKPLDLSGDWYTLNGKDPTVSHTVIIQNGNEISTETKFEKNGATSTSKGVIDPQKLEIQGTWSYSLGGNGTFTLQIRENGNQLAGANNMGDLICMARDQTNLPKICDWK